MSSIVVCVLFASTLFTQAEAKKRRDPRPDVRFDEVVRALESGRPFSNGEEIAKRIRSSFDSRFPTPRAGHLVYRKSIVWFMETTSSGPVEVACADGTKHPLVRLSGAKNFAGAWTIPGNAYESRYEFVVAGKPTGGGNVRVEYFPLGPDSLPKPGVPQGTLTKMPPWQSRIYPGTVRDWWVYVPAQHDPKQAANLMVFQDGRGYALGDGNVCTVFDNLIHQKKLPPTIGVFINPGADIGEGGKPKRPPAVSRAEEYDTCTPKYAEYLEREILPEVEKMYRLKKDPQSRAICGISSGASCAFTAAWHRPDMFGRVLSHVGSYCDFRPKEKYPTLDGTNPPRLDDYRTWQVAHNYPPLIRKTPAKPIRVFLQDGSRDLDNQLGNWPLANQQMAAAFKFGGYKYKFVYADGFHSLAHGKAIMPESLIWLWSND